jgi:hypothetical protein
MSDHTPQELLDNFVLNEQGQTFINAQILDVIAGSQIRNKTLRLSSVIGNIICGTSLSLDSVLRTVYVFTNGKRSQVVAVAAGLMHNIILGGFKDFPWTQLRRDYVTHFFNSSFIPDHDPFALPTAGHALPTCDSTHETITFPETTTHGETSVANLSFHVNFDKSCRKLAKTNDEVKFWRKILSLCIKHSFTLKGFANMLIQDAAARKKRHYVGRNHLRTLTRALFNELGSWNLLRERLAIELKTGQATSIVSLLRSRLQYSATQNLIPSVRSIQRTTQTINRHFIALCQPQRTYSGQYIYIFQ